MLLFSKEKIRKMGDAWMRQMEGTFEMRCKNLEILVDSDPQLTERSVNQILRPSNISINFEKKILNKVIKKTKQMDEVWYFKRGKI